MANFSQLSIFFFFLAAIFVSSVLATNYTVGDDNGWTDSFDYTTWTKGKTFYVGDNLIFKYEAGSHNVYRVNGSEFQNCSVPVNQTPLKTGNDVIPLTKTGKKWYICGISGHCQANQKLVITVMDTTTSLAPVQSPPPNPAPPSSATKPAVSGHFGFLLMVFPILHAGIYNFI